MFMTLIPLAVLAWLILSGPLLLPALVQWLLRILGIDKNLAAFKNEIARALPLSTKVQQKRPPTHPSCNNLTCQDAIPPKEKKT